MFKHLTVISLLLSISTRVSAVKLSFTSCTNINADEEDGNTIDVTTKDDTDFEVLDDTIWTTEGKFYVTWNMLVEGEKSGNEMQDFVYGNKVMKPKKFSNSKAVLLVDRSNNSISVSYKSISFTVKCEAIEEVDRLILL